MKIESRSSKRFPNDYEFLVEVSSQSIGLDRAIEVLQEKTQYLKIISRDNAQDASVPWFPGTIKELDRFANHILSYGSDLDSDHPVSWLFVARYLCENLPLSINQKILIRVLKTKYTGLVANTLPTLL